MLPDGDRRHRAVRDDQAASPCSTSSAPGLAPGRLRGNGAAEPHPGSAPATAAAVGCLIGRFLDSSCTPVRPGQHRLLVESAWFDHVRGDAAAARIPKRRGGVQYQIRDTPSKCRPQFKQTFSGSRLDLVTHWSTVVSDEMIWLPRSQGSEYRAQYVWTRHSVGG